MNSNTMNNDVTMAGESERALLANRYRIVMQLGQGGMGSVWLAEDTQLDGKLFAIKMLPSILVSNKRAYNQLKAEALVAMKLVHPNIVQIRAFEENDGNPFLVMDYIDGETLDDWLGNRSQELGVRSQGIREVERPHEPLLNVADIIRLLKPIAEALDYAHTEGVVHRDIKPANVMIRKDGRPFIMDFGIAREIQETMTRVTGKMSSGTLMYMSPEQLNGDVPKPAQDVYSFAAMVYECLKGEPPFCRGAIEDQIKNKAPEVLGDDITVASSVMSGLSKRPEDRPKTCADVLKVNSNTLQSSSKNREVWPGRSPLREAKSLEACERTREPRGGFFGNIAAIILLVFGLVGGIWYWQGTHENEVVSDLLIPAKPPPPSPPLSGPTELDVTEIKVESSVQKERIGRIDDADGFKIRKDGLSDLYIKAVAYENAKSWSNAAINYTNYVEGCKALLALNNERNLADKNRKIAESAKVGAERADSAKYVSVQWNEALANAKIAGEKFAAMEFAKASHLYENAAGQFLKCELNAKKECARLKQEEEQREVALREKERLAAVAARSFALKESKRAEEEGAKQYAVDSWNRIVADWKSADDLLKEKRYAEAKNKFDEIAKAYADCIEETQRAKSDEPSYFTYEVRSDDSLMRILGKYRVKRSAWREISKINKLISGRVSVGQKLKIPKSLLGSADREEKVNEGKASPNHGDRKILTLPGGETMTMIYVAPGSFMMGSPTSEEGRYDNETQHHVTLTKGYWLGETEVTQAQWESVMGSNPSRFKGASRPVEKVSWEDCQEFIAKVNREARRQFGGDARLPTEAEWEYACRAGSKTAYSWGNSLNGDKANCDGNYPCGTTIKGTYKQETVNVCSYSPNAWGFYDMHGNVYEWCQDWYGAYPSGAVTDPNGQASGDDRVLRGGCWEYSARFCRSASCYWGRPGVRYGDCGFRLCCSALP